MCGITGFIEPRSANAKAADREELLLRLLEPLARRGPDGSGTELLESESGDWSASFGHRRLAIIGLQSGRQPMRSPDGSLCVTFNGEITNYRELRSELASRYEFSTDSDVEVLLAAWQIWGHDAPKRLNGMFAFAVWDKRTATLTLARDRFGIKPLYYAVRGHARPGVVFSSDLRSFRADPTVDCRLRPRALVDYLVLDYIPGPGTIYAGVRELPPASWIEWTADDLARPSIPETRPYWTPPDPDPRLASVAPEEIWLRLKDAVRRSLVADVPVGLLLSGGIDSTAILAAASDLGAPLECYNLGFDSASFDESARAAATAARFVAPIRQETLTEERLLEILPAALESLDQPLADPSLVPTYAVSRLASRAHKVVLGGDGGDETWCGYPTYPADWVASRFGTALELLRPTLQLGSRAGSALAHFVRGTGASEETDSYFPLSAKIMRFYERFDSDPLLRHLHWMAGSSSAAVETLLSPPTSAKRVGVLASIENAIPDSVRDFAATGAGSIVDACQRLDLRTYLAGAVLTKVDRASMANGLEVRPPFLDHEFADFALSIPSSAKLDLPRFAGKKNLRQALQGRIPAEVLCGRKHGFAMPLARWLRHGGPLSQPVGDLFASSTSVWARVPEPRPDAARLSALFDEHASGKRNHAKVLWASFVWLRHLTLAS